MNFIAVCFRGLFVACACCGRNCEKPASRYSFGLAMCLVGPDMNSIGHYLLSSPCFSKRPVCSRRVEVFHTSGTPRGAFQRIRLAVCRNKRIALKNGKRARYRAEGTTSVPQVCRSPRRHSSPTHDSKWSCSELRDRLRSGSLEPDRPDRVKGQSRAMAEESCISVRSCPLSRFQSPRGCRDEDDSPSA